MEDNDSFGFGVSAAEEDSVGFSGYSDFHTIDWQRDLARDRMRHRHIVKKRKHSLWELIKVNFAQQQKWFITIIIQLELTQIKLPLIHVCSLFREPTTLFQVGYVCCWSAWWLDAWLVWLTSVRAGWLTWNSESVRKRSGWIVNSAAGHRTRPPSILETVLKWV